MEDLVDAGTAKGINRPTVSAAFKECRHPARNPQAHRYRPVSIEQETDGEHQD